MALAGTASTAEPTKKLFGALSPEVFLLDLDLPGSRTIEAIREIVAEYPSACIIAPLTDEWDEIGRAALVASRVQLRKQDRLATYLPAAILPVCGKRG